MKIGILAFLAALILGTPAMAQTVGPGTGATPNSFVTSDATFYQGQTVRAVNTNLSSVSLQIRNGGPSNYQFRVFSFDTATNTLGPTALYTTNFAPPAGGTYSFNNINVTTTNGSTLAFVISGFNANPSNVIQTFTTVAGYADGSRITGSGNPERSIATVNGDDMAFSATFTAAAAAPEPATWGLMILGFGLVGAALRRRRDADGRRTAIA